MNYLRHKAEDLVMDESFQQYCTGTNPAAVRFWEQWLAAHPEKRELVQAAKVIYLRLNGGLDAETFAGHHRRFTDALLAEGIRPGMQAPQLRPVTRTNGWKWYTLAVAATLTGLVLTMVWMQAGKDAPAAGAGDGSTAIYASKPGERKAFQLPDGTKVVLNAASTLWLDDGFQKGKRTLTLDGEAFFDIAQDASSPFVIHTEDMDITVLGTAFNVKAYKDDETVETSLIRGRVRIDTRAGHQVYLQPKEKLVIARHKEIQDIQPLTPRQADTKKAGSHYLIDSLTHIPHDSAIVELSWVDNRLIFADDTFGDIARKLERWYGVQIRFESEELRGYRFTGHFNKETLQRVLEVLQLSRGFRFRFEDDHTVVLHP
ncbi:FecR domain-containing protein [Chitinophaga caseinilytica]|uniref:FecR domain-containing protein n=1 Tax=Chitinophaga caseinilytica TaxID=2267521 RepID=UPI003C30E190